MATRTRSQKRRHAPAGLSKRHIPTVKDRHGIAVDVRTLMRNRAGKLATVRRFFRVDGEVMIEIELACPIGHRLWLSPADLLAKDATWKVHARFGKLIPKAW